MKSDRPEIIPLAVFTLWLFVLALRPIESFDTFWQLQSGKYIWQTKQFLYQDTFSLAGSMFRLEHCWLHDLILYLLFSLGGYTLLGLLKPLVIALCGALLLRRALRCGVDAVLALPILILCLLASSDSWLTRPQLWTFLFGLLFLQLLYLGREKGARAWLWLVPLMLLWANLHAACIFGFALGGAFWVGELWRAWRGQTSWRSLAVLTGCGVLVFAVAFVNPYGHRIPLRELLSHLNQVTVITGTAPTGMAGNMEWLPPTFGQVPWFYVVMLIWGFTVLWRLLRRSTDVAELVTFAGFCYMGFSQIRHTTLVALMAGFFLPQAVQAIVRQVDWRPCPKRVQQALRGVAYVIPLAWLALVAARGQLGFGVKPYEFPHAAATFVKEANPPGNLYNAYDWGGYLMWRLYPDYLVFVDGRSTSKHYFDESSRIENGWDGWDRSLLKEGVNLIVTRTCFYDSGGPQNLIDRLNRRPTEWALVFQDETAVAYVRRIPENEDLIRRHGMSNHLAYRTMLAEATRLLAEGYPRPRAWLALGRAHFALGDQVAARDAFRTFLQSRPDDREALQMVSLLNRKLGE